VVPQELAIYEDLTARENLVFRDKAALIFMLAAPFLLTLGMGLVTGRYSATSSGPSGISVIIVNQDNGILGQALVDTMYSEELSSLLAPSTGDSAVAARQSVDGDQVSAAVIVPQGFTDSIIPTAGGESTGATIPIELYANPTRPTSVGILQTILDAFITQMNVQSVSAQVIVQQLVVNGLIPASEAVERGREIGLRQNASTTGTSIYLESKIDEGKAASFDILAYMAPGMAMMFLMYVVSRGGYSFLEERQTGTLARLQMSPTTTAQVLGGKVFGIFLAGAAQMFILIAASAVFFQLNWGNPLPVILLVLASVTGAVGWGMLILAFAKTAGQVSAIGSAVMLMFGILGGSFFQVNFMPGWFKSLRQITPNAWSIDGFTILARGGGLMDITGILLTLCVMG
ncbi:MAG: ABC transporter permease, partial [Anaerolineae bacterium]|nr:ABC transporter permease [Anaerolineae bacterium]